MEFSDLFFIRKIKFSFLLSLHRSRRRRRRRPVSVRMAPVLGSPGCGDPNLVAGEAWCAGGDVGGAGMSRRRRRPWRRRFRRSPGRVAGLVGFSVARGVHGWRRMKWQGAVRPAVDEQSNGGGRQRAQVTFWWHIGRGKRGEREYLTWKIYFYLQLQTIGDVCDEFLSSVSSVGIGFWGFFLWWWRSSQWRLGLAENRWSRRNQKQKERKKREREKKKIKKGRIKKENMEKSKMVGIWIDVKFRWFDIRDWIEFGSKELFEGWDALCDKLN